MGGVVSIKWTSKSLLNIRYLGICTRRAYDNEPTFLAPPWERLTNSSISLYLWCPRALFWMEFLQHTHTAQTTWNCQIPRFWRNVWTSFPFYLSARRGFTILCCCCFFVDSSKGTDSARPHQQRCRVCVCVSLSPRLFNVFSPPFGIVYIFFYFTLSD